MGICIDRCLCFQQSFHAIKALAQHHQCQTLEELSCHVNAGKKCGLCLPYIARMLRTGETIFHEIITASAPSELQYKYENITDKPRTGGHDTRRNSNPCDRNG